jgi:hypothetical protein
VATPPVTTAEEVSSNGNGSDFFSIKVGGKFFRLLLPYLVGAGLFGGGWLGITKHNAEIEALKAGQANLEKRADKQDGKLDTILIILRKRR